MKIACCNIRGLNQPHKQKAINTFVKEVDILGIVKNNIRYCNIDTVFKMCAPGWKMMQSSAGVGMARVWFCWNSGKITFQMGAMHQQAITGFVANGQKQIGVTMVYANNTKEGRRVLWDILLKLKTLMVGILWLIIGDFN